MAGRISEEGLLQAKRALSAFRSLQPTLNAYARMLTGMPTIQVVEAAHNNGSTDGSKIYYRPPIALGEQLPHQSWSCDKRNDDGLQMCPSCAQREEIIVTIYHEIAHIWFNSFEEASERHKADALSQAVALHPGRYAGAIRDRIRRAPSYVTSNYMGLAGLISEFLPKIINCLEDARVNTELFKAMPGTRVMFDANTRKTFREGVEQVDESGNWVKELWSEYPLNAQVICGLFCKSSGYPYREWFHPVAVAALDDEKLTDLIERNALSQSMGDVFGLSFPVLVRLRELGFCRSDVDPEDEEEPPPLPSSSGPRSDEQPDEQNESCEEEGQSGDRPENDSDESSGDEEPAESDSSGYDNEDCPGGEENNSLNDEAEESGEADVNSEGSSSDDQKVKGSSGSRDRDELDEVSGSDDLPGDSRDDSAGNQSLDQEDNSSGEDWTGDTSSAPEDAPGRGHDSPPEEGIQDAGDDSAGDGNDDLGGSSRLDAIDGPTLQPSEESESNSGRTGSDGGDVDGGQERLDTGPYTTGTQIVVDEEEEEEEEAPLPKMGTPEDAELALLKLGDHEPPSKMRGHQIDDESEIMQTAIVQGVYFETPSSNIVGVHHYNFPDELYARKPWEFPAGELESVTGSGWHYGAFRGEPTLYAHIGVEPKSDESFDPPEQVVASALLKARLAFSDNVRGRNVANLRAGKVNGRVLGKRAPVGDDRLMRKKLRPAKKSYFVCIGIDISFSTVGENIVLAKKLAMAECEMLSRLGVRFAVFAHSAERMSEYESETGLSGIHMTVYNVKLPDQPWTNQARHRLKSLGPDSANLDGHQIEYYRKILNQRPETTKILHYYTDGAMPAENHNEELVILQRELKKLRREQCVVLGVGIRTDSPRKHGLETVELNAVEDIIRVISHLERELTGH